MSKDIIKDRILVIDFGSQYTQLIARRVREIGVYCEIYHYKSSLSSIKKLIKRIDKWLEGEPQPKFLGGKSK